MIIIIMVHPEGQWCLVVMEFPFQISGTIKLGTWYKSSEALDCAGGNRRGCKVPVQGRQAPVREDDTEESGAGKDLLTG